MVVLGVFFIYQRVIKISCKMLINLDLRFNQKDRENEKPKTLE